MWMRIARHYSFLYSPITSAKYRVHAKSYSRSDLIRMLESRVKSASSNLLSEVWILTRD